MRFAGRTALRAGERAKLSVKLGIRQIRIPMGQFSRVELYFEPLQDRLHWAGHEARVVRSPTAGTRSRSPAPTLYGGRRTTRSRWTGVRVRIRSACREAR